jgi:hydrogenase maturation protease
MKRDMVGTAPRIGVIGIGNPLMGDEGVGPAVIERLKDRRMPSCVELIDAGSAGMSLLHILVGLDAAIIIDAADFCGRPGEVRVFAPDEAATVKDMPRESLHEADLMRVLELSRGLGELPERTVIVAVQFGSISPSTHMTEEVRKAVDEAKRVVVREVERVIRETEEAK